MSAEPECAVAGDRSNDAQGVDFADAAIPEVGDEEVAGAIHCYADGIIQLGENRRPSVAAESSCAVARYRGDTAQRVDFADAIAEGFRDEQVSATVHGHASGPGQTGAGGRATIAVASGRSAAASHRRDRA